jgi:hypothetical protein
MQELIQAEPALRPPIDEAAEFTILKQELEEFLDNSLLPFKDGNKHNDPLSR